MPVKKAAKTVARKSMERRDSSHHLRLFKLGEGLPSLVALEAELADMWDVLMGRTEPPINSKRTDALMEVADAYFARASEITALIQQSEREGTLPRTSSYVKFRTGELRTFMDMCKRAADLGSRRITMFQLTLEHERRGRES